MVSRLELTVGGRPTACREYLVTSEAAHCAAPRPDIIRIVPLAGDVSSALACVDAPGNGLARWVPLIVALDWSRAHPDQAPVEPAPDIPNRLLVRLVPSA
jgi:hypothetical protein